MRPLWYSFGPKTLKNFMPAQKSGFFFLFDRPLVEFVLRFPVGIQGMQLFDKRVIVAIAVFARSVTWAADEA